MRIFLTGATGYIGSAVAERLRTAGHQLTASTPAGSGSHGDTGGKVVDETSPANPAELVRWRQNVEQRVLDGATRGIRSVVIRPAIVYGRGGGIPAGVVDSARKEGAKKHHREPLLLGVSGPSRPVSEIAAAASRGAGAGGRTVATPLEEARKKMGAYADALVLDQQASGRRAQDLLGWKPRRPDILDELERGSHASKPTPARV